MEVIIIMLIIWGLFALAGYKMAEKRGRNTTLGAVLGFFLGIFALIGYVIVGKTEKKQMEDMRKFAKMIKTNNPSITYHENSNDVKHTLQKKRT